MLGIAQRRRLGVDLVRLLADVGGAQDAQALGIGGHDAVLDAVVHHLDEVTGTIRAAVQVALLGGAADFLAPGRARDIADARAPAWRRCGSRCFTTACSPPIIMQ